MARPRQYGESDDDRQFSFTAGARPGMGTPSVGLSRGTTRAAGRGPAKPTPRQGDPMRWLKRNIDYTRDLWRNANQRTSQDPIDDTQYSKSLEDFLAMAERMLSGDKSTAINGVANQEAALRRAHQDISNQLRGGYSGLSSFIAGQAEPISSAYDTAVQGSAEAAQRAQAAISEGAAAAQAQQQAILARLGISDANIPIANTGTTLEQQTSQAITDSAQRAQNSQTELTSNKASQLGYNSSMGTSAAMEGQSQQDALGRQLMMRLAELADQRTQIESQSNKSALDLAQQLMGADYQLWEGNYNRKYQANRDALDLAIQKAQAANTSPEMNSTSWNALGPVGQASYALQQSGVPAEQVGPIISLITEEMAKGNIRNEYSFIKAVQEEALRRGLEPISTQNAAALYYNYFG